MSHITLQKKKFKKKLEKTIDGFKKRYYLIVNKKATMTLSSMRITDF